MAMMLKEKDRKAVQEMFGDLAAPVTLKFFTQDFECGTCATARQLVEEVASLSDKLKLEVHDFAKEAAVASSYGVDKIPALVLLRDGEDRGIRFFGVPAGYEFATLLEGIRVLSSGDSKLAPDTRSALAGLKKKVHLQVYVTPT